VGHRRNTQAGLLLDHLLEFVGHFGGALGFEAAAAAEAGEVAHAVPDQFAGVVAVDVPVLVQQVDGGLGRALVERHVPGRYGG